jgi:CTP:molybdopterin cytidylyltransferase MocA
MGQDKALMEANGQTFLGRILSSLRDGGVAHLLVVVRHEENLIAREARSHGAEVVVNADPHRGPVSSLQAGIRTLSPETPGVLFAPVDHPLFSPETVRALCAAFFETGAPLVVPSFEGWRGHPVLFGSALFPELLEEDLPEGARTVVRRYLKERIQLDVRDPGILADIDTPDEYRRHFSEAP